MQQHTAARSTRAMDTRHERTPTTDHKTHHHQQTILEFRPSRVGCPCWFKGSSDRDSILRAYPTQIFFGRGRRGPLPPPPPSPLWCCLPPAPVANGKDVVQKGAMHSAGRLHHPLSVLSHAHGERLLPMPLSLPSQARSAAVKENGPPAPVEDGRQSQFEHVLCRIGCPQRGQVPPPQLVL